MHLNSKLAGLAKPVCQSKINYVSLLFISLSFSSLACGGSYSGGDLSPAASTFSCIQSSGNECIDYESGYTAVSSQSACSGISGTYSSSSNCTSTSRVATCMTTTNNLTTTVSYYSPHWSVGSAMTDCQGTFVSS